MMKEMLGTNPGTTHLKSKKSTRSTLPHGTTLYRAAHLLQRALLSLISKIWVFKTVPRGRVLYRAAESCVPRDRVTVPRGRVMFTARHNFVPRGRVARQIRKIAEPTSAPFVDIFSCKIMMMPCMG
jgi:hypothetical protein